MPSGASWHFDDVNDTGNLVAANLNTLEGGGNVYRTPGQLLQINVSALAYWVPTGGSPTLNTYAGTTGQGVTLSQTNYVYLDATGTLVVNTTGFPATSVAHIRLATVVASATTITSITDNRPKFSMPSPGAGGADLVSGPSPAVSTDGAAALWDGTTGRLLKDGPVPGAASGLATLDAGSKLLLAQLVAHATTHQHGGSDEVATATPAANAIPKADGTNKLASGWGGAANSLATLDGSALLPLAQLPSHAATHQHGGADEVATATPGANAIPKANGSGKLASGWGGSANGLATLDGSALLPLAQLPGHATTHQHGGADEIATVTPAANSIPKSGAGGTLAVGWIPGHASTHQHGGTDEIATATAAANAIPKADGTGKLDSGWFPATVPPSAHASTHENGGSDEISVAGLSGLLADGQTPLSHATSHKHGGSDEVATATPGANLIPKAESGGDLNPGWLSNVVGYIDCACLEWSSVSQVTIGLSGETSRVADSTGVYVMSWSGTKTIDITGSGAGGLDTGSEAASTWYAVHAIGDTSGVNAPAGMLSLSATAPTLPSGYDVFRRVGYVRNDSGSDLKEFQSCGCGGCRQYFWLAAQSTRQVLSGGSAVTPTSVDLSSWAAPCCQSVQVLCHNADNSQTMRVYRDTTGNILVIYPPTVQMIHWAPTTSSQVIAYDNDAAGGNANIYVLAWRDSL